MEERSYKDSVTGRCKEVHGSVVLRIWCDLPECEVCDIHTTLKNHNHDMLQLCERKGRERKKGVGGERERQTDRQRETERETDRRW